MVTATRKKKINPSDEFSDLVLDWYDSHRRHLPWRAAPGAYADPYHVWLSEIMLQQTTVATVKSYFEKFLMLWPKVGDLAQAELDEILHAWQGLGYYARARNLHKCAVMIGSEFGGEFPGTEEGLIKLPGIGPYTAAAIAAIAFGQKASPVDGNIERVMARRYAVKDPIPGSKKKLQKYAVQLTPDDRAGDYAQALMDIGATICTPKKPMCAICPISKDCVAQREGNPDFYPVRKPKKKKRTRYGTVFWLSNSRGQVLLRRREEKGLLGGMIEVPSSEWREKPVSDRNEAPVKVEWNALPGIVRHTFTHFHLELSVVAGNCPLNNDVDGIWCEKSDFGNHALPTVMKKVVSHSLKYST